MKPNHWLRNLLIFLLGFLSVGAFYGSILLTLKPDGSAFQMPTELLKDSPFRNYLVPALILMITFGIIPALLIIGLLRKPNSRILDAINLLKDHHFSWTFTVYIGFALIIWINIQMLIVKQIETIQIIYSTLGIIIVCVALLPGVRNLYRKA